MQESGLPTIYTLPSRDLESMEGENVKNKDKSRLVLGVEDFV
jgi:hypothetical protein